MNKILLGIFTLFLAVSGVGQDSRWPTPTDKDFPVIALRGNTVGDFIPVNFEAVSTVYGDLNGDDRPDAAVHIKGVHSRFVTKLEFGQYDSNPRILLILFQESNGQGYRLAERNDRFITTPDSPAMSEPFQGMHIKNRVLWIDFELWLSAGSWGTTNATYKFRYQNGKIYLIGADREDSMRNASEYYRESYNFSTRKVKSSEGIRDGMETKITWRSLPKVRIRTLSELGPAFSWEITRGTFL